MSVEALLPEILLQPKVPEFQVRAFEALLQLLRPAPLKTPAKRLEEEAVVAKKLVEVAEVVVPRVLIKSDTPFRVVRLFKVVVAARAVSKRTCVQKRLPLSVRLAVLAKREAKVAVLAKIFVLVAWVEVELKLTKFCKVVEPVTKTCPPIFAKEIFGSK